MINRIIKEIKVALDNECYIVALMSALTLPDICGRSAYPNLISSGARYKKWCDEYVYSKIQHTDEDGIGSGITYLNGEIIYNLRCCLLHQGSTDIDGKKCEVEDFELLIPLKNEFDVCVANFGVTWENDDLENRKRHIRIPIRSICMELCRDAELYYKKHGEEFGFIKYKIMQINPNAEHPWEYSTEVSW